MTKNAVYCISDDCTDFKCQLIESKSLHESINHSAIVGHLIKTKIIENLSTNCKYYLGHLSDLMWPEAIIISDRFEPSSLMNLTISIKNNYPTHNIGRPSLDKNIIWNIPIKFLIEMFPPIHVDGKIIISLPKRFFLDKFVKRKDLDKFILFMPKNMIKFLNKNELLGIPSVQLQYAQIEYELSCNSPLGDTIQYDLQMELIDIYSTEKRRALAQCASDILIHQIHELLIRIDPLDSLDNLYKKTIIDCRRTKDAHLHSFLDQINDSFDTNECEYMVDLDSFVKNLRKNLISLVPLSDDRDRSITLIKPFERIINIGKTLHDIKSRYVQKYTKLILPLARIVIEYIGFFHTDSYAMIDSYKIKLYLCVDNCLNICGGGAWPSNYDSIEIINN